MKITIMRLSLGAIIGIVSESAAAAPVLGLVISVVFALFFARHEPYAERSDNTLSITLAFSLVLFFLAALMIKVDAASDDEHDQEVFGMATSNEWWGSGTRQAGAPLGAAPVA